MSNFVSAYYYDFVHVEFPVWVPAQVPVGGSLSVSASNGVPVVLVVRIHIVGVVLYPEVWGGVWVSVGVEVPVYIGVVGIVVFPVSVPGTLCPYPCVVWVSVSFSSIGTPVFLLLLLKLELKFYVSLCFWFRSLFVCWYSLLFLMSEFVEYLILFCGDGADQRISDFLLVFYTLHLF